MKKVVSFFNFSFQVETSDVFQRKVCEKCTIIDNENKHYNEK